MTRARFAPSPTGSLHVGNARLAVLNWIFSRHTEGTFVLRIEDTDEERNLEGSERQILEDLAWLGLYWDEGPALDAGAHETGNFGPYRQSERGALYREHAQRLLEAGAAFHCYCSEEELETRRQAAVARNETPKYDGTCLRRSPAEVAQLRAGGRQPAVRFHVGSGDDVLVEDIVRGAVRFPRAEIGDFVLLRSDGEPTYNFAVVVDDTLMQITHVIHGVGHLSNTPRQVLLFNALGIPLPAFAHVPQVLGPDRQKLSKRHGARPLADYRREGYHPDALVNYLSLLSWSSTSGEEVLTRERLVAEISLERIGAANVVFDPAKLEFLSAKHIERMPLAELVQAVTPYIDRAKYSFGAEQLGVAVAAVRSHLFAFSQISPLLAPFAPLEEPPEDALRALGPSARPVLVAAHAELSSCAWEPAEISAAVKRAGKSAGAAGRALFEPIRVAITGQPHGPPLGAVLYVQGRDPGISAMARALEVLA